MSSFQAVNTTLSVPAPDPGRPGDETTPTTPRPNTTFFPEPQPSDDARNEDASAKTPTRNSFGGLARQRPLPGSPFTPSHETADPTNRNGTGPLKRENSHRSTFSVDSQDIDMGRDEEGHEASDNDSAGSGGDRPSKKKKGQRFFCKDYPPCKLSFTRSEHLARHIRYVASIILSQLELTTQSTASTQANDPSHATALDASPGSITSDSMRRRSMQPTRYR